MTDQLTDNELIAEFMGLVRREPNNNYNLPQWWQPTKDKREKGKFIGYPEQLKYHSSWDKLMPVVERLQEPEISTDGDKIIRSGLEITIYYKACDLSFTPDEDFEDCEDFEIQTQGETKMEAIYKAVVEFIKWYNNQQKP